MAEVREGLRVEAPGGASHVLVIQAEGDLVVHQDHGIGRYDGLVTLTVSGAPHDCLRLLLIQTRGFDLINQTTSFVRTLIPCIHGAQ